jgi:phage shock protein C
MRRHHRHTRGRVLYRSRDGVVAGVCSGLARYFNLSLFWVRMVAVILLLLTGLWPVVGIYIAAALLMKPEPVRPIANAAEQEFYDSYVSSRRSAVERIKRRFSRLERRIQRLEDTVTGPEFDWDQRLNNGS